MSLAHGIDARDREILRLRRCGMTLKAVCEKYDLSRERIRQIVAGQSAVCGLCHLPAAIDGDGVCKGCRPLNRDLHNPEMTNPEIDAKYGFGSDSVLRMRKSRGIQYRKIQPGEQRRILPRPLPADILDPASRTQDLERKYGVHQNTITRVRRLAGLRRTTSVLRRPWEPKDDARMNDLLYSGYTDSEIAERLGRTKNAVSSRLQTIRRLAATTAEGA